MSELIYGRRAIVAWLLGISASLIGCVPTYTDFDAFVVTPRQSHSQKPYVIEPPDVVMIIAPDAPEVHLSTHQLRPDGYITLALIGDHLASGRTPTQLSMEVQEKLNVFFEKLTSPVQIRVTSFASKFYYVAGETRAGPVVYTGNDTVFGAVMKAGLLRSSWPSKSVVIRPNEDGDLVRRMSIDLKSMIEKGDFSQNAILEEGDVVFVPINPMAQIGVAIQNVLAPVAPALSAIATPSRAAAAMAYPVGGGVYDSGSQYRE